MKTLAIFAFLVIFQAFGQEKEVRLLKGEKNYRLVSKTENSDLNYKLFDQFGSPKIYSGSKFPKEVTDHGNRS